MRKILIFLLLLAGARAEAQLSPGPLSRAHSELEGITKCTQCHALGRKSLDLSCLKCHVEIRWLRDHQQGLHAQAQTQECVDCHSEHAGKDFGLVHWEEGEASKFQHERSGWALEGKHGESDCSSCHRSEYQTSPVAKFIQGNSGSQSYLGLLTDCMSCHSDDHQQSLGADCKRCHSMEGFKISNTFQHADTKFALTGMHSKLKCTKCHAQFDPDGKSLLHSQQMSTDCASCHNDPHKNRFGVRCADCHNENSWQQIDSARFNHSKTKFPLRAAHARIECKACHDEVNAWGKTPRFASCTDCHTTPHEPEVATECGVCHNEDRFVPSSFDTARHQELRFTLTGRHEKVECAACHRTKPNNKLWLRLESSNCADCHANSHGEQLASLKSVSASCESCHDSQEWKPSGFGVEQHAATEFALDATHAALDCVRCHAPQNEAEQPGLNFILDARRCADCHSLPHEKDFARESCTNCHSEDAWIPSIFEIEAHAATKLPLDGGHAATPCILCHTNFRVNAPRGTAYANSVTLRLPTECNDCHGKNAPALEPNQ